MNGSRMSSRRTAGTCEVWRTGCSDRSARPTTMTAPIVGRSPAAARQLASRGRRRVRQAGSIGESDRNRRREVVEAFLAASRRGDFEALIALLDPDVVLRADRAAIQVGATT